MRPIPEEGISALAEYVTSQKGQANSESQDWGFMANMFLGNDVRERGELVFKRFACWSCHGEQGEGDVRNPNMAPDELIPGLKRTADNYTMEELFERLSKRVIPAPLNADNPAPPFFCPDHANNYG